MLRITPYGAAGEVTGSAYMLETDAATVLVDFGMFQGDKDDDARNVVPGGVHRATVNAVLLTHGHLDHSGRLPVLIRDGYRGPIYCTQGTRDIAEIILNDAAHIQVSDYERKQRRAQRTGEQRAGVRQGGLQVQHVGAGVRVAQVAGGLTGLTGLGVSVHGDGHSACHLAA